MGHLLGVYLVHDKFREFCHSRGFYLPVLVPVEACAAGSCTSKASTPAVASESPTSSQQPDIDVVAPMSLPAAPQEHIVLMPGPMEQLELFIPNVIVQMGNRQGVVDVFLTNFRIVFISEDTHSTIDTADISGSADSRHAMSASSDTFMERNDLTERIRMHADTDLSTYVGWAQDGRMKKRGSKENRGADVWQRIVPFSHLSQLCPYPLRPHFPFNVSTRVVLFRVLCHEQIPLGVLLETAFVDCQKGRVARKVDDGDDSPKGVFIR